MNFLPNFKPDKSWTLFLDRDGVINTLRENDYVKNWEEFEFIEGTLAALSYLSGVFGRICITTNQQGIGRGLMTEFDLDVIHEKMMIEIENAGGRIDKIYHCPYLASAKPTCRKPEIGMGLQAMKDFPDIKIEKTLMVGDSDKDMEFAKRLGAHRCNVNGVKDKFERNLTYPEITNLWSLASYIQTNV